MLLSEEAVVYRNKFWRAFDDTSIPKIEGKAKGRSACFWGIMILFAVCVVYGLAICFTHMMHSLIPWR